MKKNDGSQKIFLKDKITKKGGHGILYYNIMSSSSQNCVVFFAGKYINLFPEPKEKVSKVFSPNIITDYYQICYKEVRKK